MSSLRPLFITTALPFANGPFHIGHIMEYIQADIWVRFQRMQGSEVHFVCADDAHGAPIMLKAEAEGITPQALVGGPDHGRIGTAAHDEAADQHAHHDRCHMVPFWAAAHRCVQCATAAGARGCVPEVDVSSLVASGVRPA